MSIEGAEIPEVTKFDDGRVRLDYPSGIRVMRFPDGNELDLPTEEEVRNAMARIDRRLAERLKDLQVKLPRWDREMDFTRITI